MPSPTGPSPMTSGDHIITNPPTAGGDTSSSSTSALEQQGGTTTCSTITNVQDASTIVNNGPAAPSTAAPAAPVSATVTPTGGGGSSWRRRTKRAPQRVTIQEIEDPADMSPDEEMSIMLSSPPHVNSREKNLLLDVVDRRRQRHQPDSEDELDERLGQSPNKKSALERLGGGDSLSIADSTSDVERFDGKIVYNPDGSAYIIEDSELSDDDASLDVPQLDGCIVDGRGVNLASQLQVSFPQIANAFYISRNPSLYSALYGQAYANILRDKKLVPDVPVMHSYRVYTVRDKCGDSVEHKLSTQHPSHSSTSSSSQKVPAANKDEEDDDTVEDLAIKGEDGESSGTKTPSKTAVSQPTESVPIKPILMCFMCKLSFGYAKSFVAHAMSDHNLVLLDDEKEILNHKNASAIIQCVGKEKEPLVSFLEPLAPPLSRTELMQQRAGSPSVSAAAAMVAANAMKTLMAAASSSGSGLNLSHNALTTSATSSSAAQGGVVTSQNEPSDETQTSLINSRISPNVPETVVSLQPQQQHGMDLTRKSPIASGRSNSASPGTSPSPSTLSPLQLHQQALQQQQQQQQSSLPPPPPSFATSSMPQPPNFLTGTTIGVCPDHMTGRPSGVECAKCEMILNSSRLGQASGQGGLLAGIHSRNSCKTLKCPKCNWHYKYQETLEIHMKEKHPENETSCIYCIAGQPHPRLARGETYTCGYKPYRCEVCNYSTTTKGNLSIHMQSDKHLNNMQELQNGGAPNADSVQHQSSTPSPASHKALNLAASALSPPCNATGSGGAGGTPGVPNSPISSASSSSNKPKPTFRCDVCNYETNVARNLRIHMTSEKHTHNMMVLQQNVKHMQQLSALQQAAQSQMAAAAAGGGFDPATAAALLHFHPGLTLQGDKPPPHTEAALADMAYNQALLIQMMTGGQLPPHVPPELAPHVDLGLNPDTMEPPPEPPEQNPSFLFQCCVCTVFSTDSLEALSHHLAQDRTKLREQEILALVGGNYVCKLCTYKTNLKANFQLHCKTDKHLQRLQHVNHIKEGGNRNEWKLKYVSVSNPVQVRCHACDYYTNSAHKLQLHAAHQRHEVSRMVFRHLSNGETALRDSEPRIFHCALCGFSARSKLPLLQHVRSMKHLQMEQLHQLQRRSEGKEPHTDIGEVFQVIGQGQLDASMQQQLGLEPEAPTSDRKPERRGSLSGPSELAIKSEKLDPASMLKFALEQQQQQQQQQGGGSEGGATSSDETSPETPSRAGTGSLQICPYCNFSSHSEMRVQAHILTQHASSLQQHHQQQLAAAAAAAAAAGAASEASGSEKPEFLCPLCQDGFREKGQLERHVMQIHSVNAEGLQRLLVLVDQSHWLNTSTRTATSNDTATDLSSSGKSNNQDDTLGDEDERGGRDEPMDLDQDPDDLKCQTCNKMFSNMDDLCLHQSESGHLELKQTPNGPGYLCWKKGCNQFFTSALTLQTHYREIHAVKIQAPPPTPPMAAVSEKHVYKYRCNQCSLAFKTLEKLQLHSQYHLIRDATKCMLCGRSFRSVLALHKHVETAHSELSEEELLQYKQSLMNNPLLLAGLGGVSGSGSALEAACNELMKRASGSTAGSTSGDQDRAMSPVDEEMKDDSECPELQGEGDNSNDSIVYKEQQFLEDYLNSQAIAEDSYNDPNRKYKCHRCKVAFTRQSYLTSHNKTLLHRKGEKLSYPMEKYLDPNRPYKCDVCKESFTQKNILLVHYNSVSHLHKLKRAMQDQQGGQNIINNNNNNGLPLPLTSGLSAKTASSPDEDDKKPYKCNICKVAYTQGSTLDIHMRSVLHQTRASKLQELALTGQIDLSRPLIEQPEHKKIMQEMLNAGSPKQISPNSRTSPTESPNSSGSLPNSGQLTSPPSSGGTNVTLPTTPNSSGIQISAVTPNSSVANTSIHACPRCSALFASQEQLTQHQQLYCMFQNPLSLFPALPGTEASSPQPGNKTPSPVPTTPTPSTPLNTSTPQIMQHLHALQQQEDPFSKMAGSAKKPSQMYKHLLESYGFELVMQFNENHQRRRREAKEEEERQKEKAQEEEEAAAALANETPAIEAPEVPEVPIPPVTVPADPDTTTILPEEESIPEVAKSTCQHCKKEFSSVWVLKAHCEEVHRDLVPHEFLEKYAQQFKNEYEKKSSDVVSTKNPGSPAESTPEKDEDNKEALAKLIQSSAVEVTATPPAPSTPTASSTPASSTDSIPAAARGERGGGDQTPQGVSMALAQQMNEMQAALNAMAASQLQQLQFNPMMMGMASLGMGLPLGLNMSAMAAMNLQPPLVPMMMPPPFDPMSPLFNPAAALDAQMMAKQQQAMIQQQQQAQQQAQQQQATPPTPQPSGVSAAAAAAAANASQQKRARTRITDDQLKILRAHFDINNSPSEEQITDMASQSGLPPKVIKHWFRNTLFKERQRNKDSPYNFNNPPSTTLNLEEYEKTGEAKVMPLSAEEQNKIQAQALAATTKNKKAGPKTSQPSTPAPPEPEMVKTEPRDELPLLSTIPVNKIIPKMEPKEHELPMEVQMMKMLESPHHLHHGGEGSSLLPPPPQASSPAGLTLSSLIASTLGPEHPINPPVTTSPASSSSSSCSGGAHMLPPPKMTPNFTMQGPTPSVLPLPGGPPTNLPPSVSPAKSPGQSGMDFQLQGSGNSNGSNSSGCSSSGKRANRTRFTDYQIKVLQEFFENNAYPKDDDLEYLSKLLGLSPRVIVVWFQNARQKARKVYENQPQVETPNDDGTGRFQRTPGLNYQCKKCLLVFQRYYELIRHQKTHCFKEEDAKRSAQAQAAAAQIAAVLSSEDSNSSAEPGQQQMGASAAPLPPAPSLFASSPVPPPPPQNLSEPQTVARTKSPSASAAVAQEGTFQCDKCNLVFPRFDLWREHQLVHIMNPNLFPTYPPDSPFGILQQHAQMQQQQQQLQQAAAAAAASLSCSDAGSEPGTPTPMQQSGGKRKLDEFDDDREDQPKDKRLRTTILPEQLDYLYQKYQIESNPSRKMLENIAREVGLKKRVVQVWFQNTRARERKGQFRAHAQVINKRCPFCPALFKVKSALESHLVTKHADQCTRGEINIDALPDEELSMEATSYTSDTSGPKMSTSFGVPNASTTPPAPSMMPPIFPPFGHDMENSLKKYYEESMKRYISELQSHAQNNGQKDPTDLSVKLKQEGESGTGASGGTGLTGDSPLDLSKPVDLSRPIKVSCGSDFPEGPLTDVSLEDGALGRSGGSFLGGEDAQSDSMSETTELNNFDDINYDELSNPVSPASSTQSSQLHQRPAPSGGGGGGGTGTSGGGGVGGGGNSNKRFRTQMSSLQVKVMKSLFNDYKTPTMAECEMLGREIGLQKRVVQVWFQNARAKEKKNKLALQKAFGTEPESPRPPEECKLCLFKYSHKYSIQDHIFTKKHIENVKIYIESGKADSSLLMMSNETSSTTPGFTVPSAPSSGEPGQQPPDSPSTPSGGAPSSETTPNPQQLAQLQMLQMAGLTGLPTQAMAAAVAAAMQAAANNNKEAKDVTKPEDLAILQQLYGLGLAGGFPGAPGSAGPAVGAQGGAQANNLFLHPSMYANVGSSTGSTGGNLQQTSTDCTTGGGGGGGAGAGQPIAGTPLTVFRLPEGTISEINQSSSHGKPGVTTIRFSMDANLNLEPPTSPLPPQCRHLEKEAAFICKKCQLAFPTESALLGHQRVICYPGKAADSRGAIRLVQQGYECKICPDRLSTYHELKIHCTTELHRANLRGLSESGGVNISASPTMRESLSPSEGLTHEMEDVVNQITALAAQAAAADGPTRRDTAATGIAPPSLEASVTG